MAFRKEVILVAVLGLLTGRASSACNDIDSSACELMYSRNPEICTDPSIGHMACPRYCKLCPLLCYHCDATVTDYHLCNQIMLCDAGEVCMKKELKSFLDGHHEYEMRCQQKAACDGSGITFGFGRRHVDPRDVTVSCCETDLCNYPQQTTTTTTTTPPTTETTTQFITTNVPSCQVDLVFLIDEANSMSRLERDILSFVHSLVSPLPVGQNGVHVAVGTFTTTAHEQFALDDHLTMSSVLSAIDAIRLRGGVVYGDLNAGLHYILEKALSPSGGDRPDADNVVVIITDDDGDNAAELNRLQSQLHAKSRNVIAIELGAVSLHSLSSDRRHEFRLSDPRQLHQILNQVSGLICA